MRIIYITALLLLLHSCAPLKSDVSNIQVLDIGSDSASSFCRKFTLTNSQVFEFFKKSKEVEINEFHSNYEYLPCYVKGTLNKGNNKCNFTIRAGGTIELTCDNKLGYLYVCDSCDNLLRESE